MKKQGLALAIYPVVAWRRAHLALLGRVHPDLPASEAFDQNEWAAAWLLAEKEPPKKTPTVREVVLMVNLCRASCSVMPAASASSGVWFLVIEVSDCVVAGKWPKSSQTQSLIFGTKVN